MKSVFAKVGCFVAVMSVMVAIAGCSLKKNTAASRQYSAFITRYNIYYNGDTHFKETLSEMENKYDDDYSQLVYVHPAEARSNEKAPQPSGDFTRSIEKAQKAIQLRSIKKKPQTKSGRSSDPEYKAWMKRDEYNPFLHNAWMLMARSQFYNGDFLGAASTFFYISKHFTWLPETVLEAGIWQARCYCAIDWLFEAETILRRIKPEQLADSKDIRHLYNLTWADLYIKSHDNEKAIPYVREAIDTAKGAQKTRLRFLLGQLYASVGDKEAAYEAFKKAGSASSATYRTKFNARIKQSEVFTGADIESEIKSLRRMTRYDRNKEYLDQIYYAIGNLYLSHGDTAQAIANYELAVEKSTRSGIDKALAQLTLGGLYYDQGKYDKAQPCYSEAIPKIPDNYPDYKTLKRRSDYLDELAVYSQNVTLQDSLLRLSYMTPQEQTAVAERLIKELKEREKKEAEEARRQEFMANNPADNGGLNGGNAASTQTFTMNNDNSWYFYNPSTVTAGKTEFQRQWGSRKLEDDWRRRNKAAFAFNTAPEEGDDEAEETEGEEGAEGDNVAEKVDAAELERQNDPHYVEYYLKQIPKDDAERATCNDVIQEGLYNMGVILKDKLEDFPAAEREFNELLTRYPDNIYRLDTYYNLYLMYVRSGEMANAERMRQLIITDFPDSPYGLAMRDPQYIENLRRMDAEQYTLYDEAYQAYIDNRNADVHRLYRTVSEKYPLSKLMPKFMFIDALAYVTEDNADAFKTTITELLERYPDTDLTPYAASYLKGLNSGRQLHTASTNMRGMLWDIALTNDSTAVAGDVELEFELDPREPQLFILLYPTDEVSPNQLLYDVARHNFSSFVVKHFDLEQMNFGRLGLLIVRPFDNLDEINHYRSVMVADKDLRLPRRVRPIAISEKNFQTLLSGHGSFDDYFRYMQDKTYHDTEESVLPADFFEQSEPDYSEPEEYFEPQYTEPESTEPVPAEEPVQEPLPVEPVQEPEPAPAVTPTPTPAATTTPTPAATTTPTPAATTTPTTPAAPSAPATPATPKPKPKADPYPVGSEGDDPLFNF